MSRPWLASTLLGVVLTPAVLATGCTSTDGQPANGPQGAVGEQRDTEIRHEECNLESSDTKRLDANGDGRPDIIKVFGGGRELCRAVDINMDTMIDVFVYFDDAGRVRRRESGFDRDAQPDEIAYYENGVLVRKERETNNDRRIDTWSYYQDGRLVKEERDSTGDGYVDQWWTFDRADQPDCAIVVTDGDGDGRPDPSSKLDTCAKETPGGTAPPPAPPAPDGAGGETEPAEVPAPKVEPEATPAEGAPADGPSEEQAP